MLQYVGFPLAGKPADLDGNPCDQLLNLKRFRDVILCAGVQQVHLAVQAVLCRNYNNRSALRRADFHQHLLTVHPGKHQIQQNQRKFRLFPIKKGFCSGESLCAFEARFLERVTEHIIDIRFIFHNQNFIHLFQPISEVIDPICYFSITAGFF
ncbi:hypothetical protein D3C75_1012380 [compost metagenome]